MCEWQVKSYGQWKKNVGNILFCYKMGQNMIQLELVLVVNIIERFYGELPISLQKI